MNDRTKEVYDFVRAYSEEYGFSPSIRDICKGVGLRSPSSGKYHLEKLERAGLIERPGGRVFRAIKVV